MRRIARTYRLPLLLSLLVAASLWPAVGFFDVSNESEQLVVAAALESRRDGSAEALWRPTLNGETRLRKPPLATWATMAVVSQPEAQRLADGPVDAAAFAWMTLKVRAVSLLAAAALLLLTFELGRVLGGRTVGLAALAVLAATYGFIEHAVRVTTDLHLAVWVLAANVCLARVVLHRDVIPPLSRERSEREQTNADRAPPRRRRPRPGDDEQRPGLPARNPRPRRGVSRAAALGRHAAPQAADDGPARRETLDAHRPRGRGPLLPRRPAVVRLGLPRPPGRRGRVDDGAVPRRRDHRRGRQAARLRRLVRPAAAVDALLLPGGRHGAVRGVAAADARVLRPAAGHRPGSRAGGGAGAAADNRADRAA